MSVLRQFSASSRRTNRSVWEAADAEVAVCDDVSSSKQHHRRVVLSSADLGVFVTEIRMCVWTGFRWLDLACVCPFFVCTEHCGRLVAHSLRILEASGSYVGTHRHHMFWLRFFILYLLPATSTQVFLGFHMSKSKKLWWFPTFQVATTCFSCSPPDLNLLVKNFIFCIHVK